MRRISWSPRASKVLGLAYLGIGLYDLGLGAYDLSKLTVCDIIVGVILIILGLGMLYLSPLRRSRHN